MYDYEQIVRLVVTELRSLLRSNERIGCSCQHDVDTIITLAKEIHAYYLPDIPFILKVDIDQFRKYFHDCLAHHIGPSIVEINGEDIVYPWIWSNCGRDFAIACWLCFKHHNTTYYVHTIASHLLRYLDDNLNYRRTTQENFADSARLFIRSMVRHERRHAVQSWYEENVDWWDLKDDAKEEDAHLRGLNYHDVYKYLPDV